MQHCTQARFIRLFVMICCPTFHLHTSVKKLAEDWGNLRRLTQSTGESVVLRVMGDTAQVGYGFPAQMGII